MKKIMKHLMTGLGIGFVLTTACLWFFRLYEASGAEVMRQFTTWLVASVFYGVVSIIYDSKIPFPLSLITHFVACAAVTFAASYISGIMDYMSWNEWFVYVLPVFIILYFITGAGIYAAARCQAKKINEKIKGGR